MEAQFFSMEMLTSVIGAMFVVGFIMQLVKMWWDKLSNGKKMYECVKATLPFFIAFPVYIAWSAYHNDGFNNVKWCEALYLVIIWGASSSYVYRWVISKITIMNPGGQK